MMEMLSYEFMQRAFLAGLIVALLCPLVGMFVVIRRQSLLGDGLGHIAFAGVTGSALLGINPAIGAVVLTLAAAGGIEIVRRKHLQYGDMGLALFFYGGLALAVVCSSLARIPNTSLMSFLFGSILTVNWANIAAIAIIALLVILLLGKFHTPLLLASFQPDIAHTRGIRLERMNMFFALLVAAVVVIGMSIVGILLVSALMIVPVAAAHLWRRGFKQTTAIAVAYSFTMVLCGLWGSYSWDLAPGGTIVLTGLALYALTAVLAPFLHTRHGA